MTKIPFIANHSDYFEVWLIKYKRCAVSCAIDLKINCKFSIDFKIKGENNHRIKTAHLQSFRNIDHETIRKFNEYFDKMPQRTAKKILKRKLKKIKNFIVQWTCLCLICIEFFTNGKTKKFGSDNGREMQNKISCTIPESRGSLS